MKRIVLNSSEIDVIKRLAANELNVPFIYLEIIYANGNILIRKKVASAVKYKLLQDKIHWIEFLVGLKKESIQNFFDTYEV